MTGVQTCALPIFTQSALVGVGTIGGLAALLALRALLGVVSYAANTPGGLFAPMLVLGSGTGLLVARVCGRIAPLGPGVAAALALTGLAAFFAASVQAPVTGLVLASELTGSVTWLSPMLGAVAVAMLVARLCGEHSIYDALADRAAANAAANAVPGSDSGAGGAG